MGAIYLVCEPDHARRERWCARLDAALREQGFGAPVTVQGRAFSLAAYGKLAGAPPQVHVAPDGRFAALAGTALVDGAVGVAAARALLARPQGREGLAAALGSYCAVRGDRERADLTIDPLGVYKLYSDVRERVFCSSFLALAKAMDALSANAQGVYEYAHQEATYGGDTVLNEIRVLRGGGHHAVGDEVRFLPGPAGWEARSDDRPVHEHVDACLDELRGEYGAIARAFGGAVDTALSGGYDSRLTLALLHEQGIAPAVHVYGEAGSADVRVARAIADGEGFALHHVDKSHYPRPEADAFAPVVRQNYLAFDGWPPAGIFDGGADLATRRERASGGRLMLNGGGGEIFRNFFYLMGRALSPREVVWAFYNRFSPAWCTGDFDEHGYERALAEKIRATVGARGARLRREEVELVYPAFRCAFWMGRNNAINNRFGWTMTPFIEEAIVRRAAVVPLRYKNHGRFEAALIRRVSPALARYPSDYGHDFATEPPPKRILADHATLLRPPWLRRYSYRIRHRRPVARPALLGADWLGRVVDPGLPRMRRFFHVERVNDPALYGRLATLEYLFADLRVGDGPVDG